LKIHKNRKAFVVYGISYSEYVVLDSRLIGLIGYPFILEIKHSNSKIYQAQASAS